MKTNKIRLGIKLPRKLKKAVKKWVVGTLNGLAQARKGKKI